MGYTQKSMSQTEQQTHAVELLYGLFIREIHSRSMRGSSCTQVGESDKGKTIYNLLPNTNSVASYFTQLLRQQEVTKELQLLNLDTRYRGPIWPSHCTLQKLTGHVKLFELHLLLVT